MSDAGPGAVAFFLPTLTGGGAERVIVNLSRGIRERGVPVDLVVASATGELVGQIPDGVRLVDLGARRVLRSLPRLVEYLRRERPRVLIASMSHGNVVAVWAGRLAGQGTRVIATVHNTMSQSTPEQGGIAAKIWPLLLRTFYPWADVVVAVSRGAADDLVRSVGLPRERVQVVYNPVITPATRAQAGRRPEHPWFAPGEPPVVLGVGRLTRQKDFATLLRAFGQVRRCRTARLMILGEGEERPRLEALARELGVAEDMALPGFRDDAVSHMAGAALFVLSSAWEGLPTVLIEAMAAGARVVSTDCPSGPREILQDGRLGALVPVGDAPALADAMLAALDRPRGAVPPDALAPFTMEAAVDHYLSLVERA